MNSSNIGKYLANPEVGEEVVISGLAGTYPNASNVFELRDKLFNKKPLIQHNNVRFKTIIPGAPMYSGFVRDVEKFDAGFFGLTYKQAQYMDIRVRKMLEKTFEAIVDAGLHPLEFRGSRTGVYIGMCNSETEKYMLDTLEPLAITGCIRSMTTNRISYWLGIDGPSYIVDSACNSALCCVESAYNDIRSGKIDRAIVGGCNWILELIQSQQCARLGILNMDGKNKCFDSSADGYTRSEAAVVIILQKMNDARRMYCQVVHVKGNNDGYKSENITFPSKDMQVQLMKEVYSECGINPNNIKYVEAHGTGTIIGDFIELSSIEEIFCNEERASPVTVGTVKSQLGHPEPASGFCSITKIILMMESGYIIPNVHYTTPTTEIKSLQNGRMVVATDPIKWEGDYIPLNNFGFGGSNSHLVLKSNSKLKISNGMPNDNISRLIFVSGRTEEAVNTILDYIAKKPIDAEFIGLLHEVYKYDIPGHNYRGYEVLMKNGAVSREFSNYNYQISSLWLVFGGVGSNCFENVADLMNIPVFSQTLDKCNNILAKKNIDLIKLITSKSLSAFAKQSDLFVAVTSIQIALLELLLYINVSPKGVVGYSIGEIACAYYDGCLDLEQALLCSYYLGECSDQCKHAKGAIVYVKTNQKEIQDVLLSGLEIVCANWDKTFLVAGPNDKIQTFIKKLNKRHIVNEIMDINYAYHSSYSKNIELLALKHLKTLIPYPKQRSDKWISSLLNVDKNKTCTAKFLSAVLTSNINFENLYDKVGNNAFALEISPNSIFKYNTKHFQDMLLLQKYSCNLNILLSIIGKLYNIGHNPRIEKIYPKITFPVSRGTSMLSPLIKWNYSQDWMLANYDTDVTYYKSDVSIKLIEKKHEYLAGHMIDERILYPATGYLMLVWEAIADSLDKNFTEIPVIFENIKFLKATELDNSTAVTLTVSIQKCSGHFEITESQTVVATGRIYVPDNIANEMLNLPDPVIKEDVCNTLNSLDIYKELKLRGYNYSGLFCGLNSIDTSVTTGKMNWKCNWVAFIDAMIQIEFLKNDIRDLLVPTSIEKLVIDVAKHNEIIKAGNEEIPVYNYNHINTLICGGIEMSGLRTTVIRRKKDFQQPVLELYKFIPNTLTQNTLTLKRSVRILLHIIFENYSNNLIKSTEVLEGNSFEISDLITPIIIETMNETNLKQVDAHIVTSCPLEIKNATVTDIQISSKTNAVVLIAKNICCRQQKLHYALHAITKGGYILARESTHFNLSDIAINGINIIAEHTLDQEKLILLSKSPEYEIKTFINITDEKNQFNWLPVLQNTLKSNPRPCIYSEGDELSGIIGLVNCLRTEADSENVCCVFIMDKDAPKFDPKSSFYANQLRKGMVVNILKNNQWGTYRYVPIDSENTAYVKHAYINTIHRGDLSSLAWLEGNLSINKELVTNPHLVHIYYSALNFRDIMTASSKLAPEAVVQGRLQQDCVLDLEFSGKLNNGRRVMGLAPQTALSNLISADPHFLWDVPDEWTLEEAVTVPVVYGTVLYAFIIQGNIRPGLDILIHSGTSGIGQAAINIALYYKCNVYVTVDNEERREFIKETWPQIKDNHIGNSQKDLFEDLIMRETNGKGVDFVLNSVSEEKLQASVRCLANGGKLLEIGKVDLSSNNSLVQNMFEKEMSFHGVMLDSFFTTENKLKKVINDLIYSHIKNGAIKPLTRNIFNENEVEKMFRYIGSSKHMGKVLLQIRTEESKKYIKPSHKLIKAISRYYCSDVGSHIVVGGLGGFGLELVDWLIIRGARKIIITSRQGITTGYQAMRLKIWKSYGVQFLISTEDVTTYEGSLKIIKQALELGPVETIFNLGAVLKDGVFINQTKENFAISFGIKATATKHLDEISRKLCSDLKQFVVFSSVTCGRGNAGQTNYGMSNSVMERICEKRHEDGFPSLVIQWGAVGDVGIVAKLQREKTEVIITGTLQQRIFNCLATLDIFLCQKEPICSSIVVADKKDNNNTASSIIEAIKNIIGITDLKTVSENSSLPELGMDSIMVVEIKQILERDFEVFYTPQELRSLTFAKLNEISAETVENNDNININNCS